jgi:hypothetical protein
MSICTDGIRSVSGSLKGFVPLPKQKKPSIIFTYREALVSKSVVPKVQNILYETIKMVNLIKSIRLQSRLFLALCSGMEVAHTAPVWHRSVAALRVGAFKVL